MTHIEQLPSFKNLLLFSRKIDSNLLTEWCANHVEGLFVRITSKMEIISGAKHYKIGDLRLPYSKLMINDGFAILFEKESDIALLKLTFDWNDAQKVNSSLKED